MLKLKHWKRSNWNKYKPKPPHTTHIQVSNTQITPKKQQYSLSISTETEQKPDADDLRQRIMNRLNIKSSQDTSLDIPTYEDLCNDDYDQKNRRQKTTSNKKREHDLSSVKIKTLAEIRAEKKLREEQERKPFPACDSEISSTNAEVSSTSKIEDTVQMEEEAKGGGIKRKTDVSDEEVVRKRPKLRRPQLTDSDNTVSSVESEKELKSVKSDGGPKKKENRVETSKLDEMLLLDEDDFEYNSNVSLQAEEDLLKDIDELLSE